MVISGQEFSFTVSHEATVTVLAMARVSSEGLVGEESAAKLTHKVVGTIQFFTGFWIESLGLLLTVGQSPSLISLPGGPHQHGSSLHQSQLERGSASKMEVTNFCNNLITEVPPHYLCHTLLFRSKSKGAN